MATGQPTVAEAADIVLVGYCLDCRKKHVYQCRPDNWLRKMDEWRHKHLGHRIEFRSPKRKVRDDRKANPAAWFVDGFKDNADIKLSYVGSGTYTMTLASLASSGTLVAGRESTAVSNTSNLYLDYMLGGKVRMGTTVTAGTLELWAIAAVDDTPTYPDVFDGTDSNETVTSADIKRGCGKLLWSMPNDTTNSRDYWWSGISLAAAYGGLVPGNHVLFFVHSAVAALDATEGNHNKSYKAAYMTSA